MKVSRKQKLGKAGMMEIVRSQANLYGSRVSYYALETATYGLIELLESLEMPDKTREQIIKHACKFAFGVGRDERHKEIDELKDKILEAIDIDLNEY